MNLVMKNTPLALLITLGTLFVTSCGKSPNIEKRVTYAMEIEQSLEQELLQPWYPLAVDTEYGGFLSTFTYDFELGDPQHKMIISQARHIWTNSKAAQRYHDVVYYKTSAKLGFQFLRDKMWDEEFGGFHELVTREGEVIDHGRVKKTASGNAYAIYALSAYYEASCDKEALELAKDTFRWLEDHAHDDEHLGYFQHLRSDGTPIPRTGEIPSTSDVGYKDQNSSIHMLEALTELYNVWENEIVRRRMEELLILIRDTITQEKGYTVLFFEPDWTPVSFREHSREDIDFHHYLDHVSFGNDLETASVMIKSSYALGMKGDSTTHQLAKKMIDHALKTGYDHEVGGFYDAGYYFKGEDSLTIVRETKNWWTQAEGLNTLLLMAQLYPRDEMDYFGKFEQQWAYIDTYLIDPQHGGWYEGGVDKQLEMTRELKGHIRKTTYHNYKAMTNSIDMLMGNSKVVDE